MVIMIVEGGINTNNANIIEYFTAKIQQQPINLMNIFILCILASINVKNITPIMLSLVQQRKGYLLY